MKNLTKIAAIAFFLFFSGTVNTGYDIGDVVKDFKLKNVDDSYVSLSDKKDIKGYILVFTCNTCPYSIAWEDRIIDLHEKYAVKGFPIIAINPNDPKRQPGDSFEEMKKRAKKQEYPFPYLQDETQDVTRAFGATNTPHVYVLNRENDQFIVEYIGAVDNNPRSSGTASEKYVEDAVDAVLNGKNVPVRTTKAIGCTIKWKRT